MGLLLLLVGMAAIVTVTIVLSNTESLLLSPLISPGDFLLSMPFKEVSLFGHRMILIQPSSTLLVYLLGLVMIIIGVIFVAKRNQQKSRLYWGLGFFLWGISALSAGTSYQAFGYELKCRGYEFCIFTDNFELVYLLITAYSINFLVAATAYTSVIGKNRHRLVLFAVIDSLAYSLFLLIGAMIPIRFLIAYEGFMSFFGINFILMFIINIRYYVKNKDELNRKMIIIWLGFLVVNIGYFVFLFGEFGSMFYQKMGVWFNENDVLHILLILWTIMVFFLLRKSLQDTAIQKK